MAEKRKRVALYARVSTDAQTTANQLRELHAVARAAGWEVVREFVDEGISGAKGRDRRPGFDELQKEAVGRRFDLVAAWSVDRLGRSLQDLVAFLNELHSVKVDLYLHQQRLDTSTPSGRALFQMCGVFAEFERAMIVARVKAGIAKAREQGTKSGKPIGRPTVVTSALERRVRSLRAKGYGIIRIAKEVRCGVGTVQRLVS